MAKEAVARLPRLRIVTALLFAFVLVSVVPLIALHFNLIRINRDALETAEKKYLTGSSVRLAEATDNYVQNALGLLRRTADGIRVVSTVTEDPFFFLSRSNQLRDYISADSGLLILRALDRDGVGSTAEAAHPDGTNPPMDPVLDQRLTQAHNVALRGQEMISEVIWPSSRPEGGILLAVPVRGGPGGDPIGALSGFLSLSPIRVRLQDEARLGVLAYLVDRRGTLIVASDPAAFPSPDLHQLELVSEFIAHPVRLTKSYTQERGGVRRRVLGTLATVPTMDWGVIVERDESSAYASVDAMTRTSSLLALFAVGLAGLVALVAARVLSRPLLDLVEKVRSVAQGQFKQRVRVRGTRELAMLADTFNSMSDSIEHAVERLRQAARENQELFLNSIRTLAAAIDAKDPYTRGHSERVARYAVVIGRHMGLTAEEIRSVRVSALLHDVGKIGIDDRILRKPTALTSEEFEVMKTHPVKGALIMGQIPQMKDIVPGIKHHHEKWGGGGYPDGLCGENIPRLARIVAVADTFDAMTTTRPYQRAMPLAYVIERIKSFAGKSFDPAVVAALEKAFAGGDLEFLGEEVSLKVPA